RGSGARITHGLPAVPDLTATAAEQGRFYASAAAFVTALATRLDCDRVSLGFVRSGRIHVRAVSHSAEFRKQANLIRAIAAAMDEAVDQQMAVVHPAPTGGAAVTRAQSALAPEGGAGAVCSVPVAAAGLLV